MGFKGVSIAWTCLLDEYTAVYIVYHMYLCNNTFEFLADDSIKDTQVVEMPIVDSLHPRPMALPLAIPEDLADRLVRLHGDPAVWWIGQFVTYLTRPQQQLADDIAQTKEKLGFSNPIVG